ncbi:hypothetical protein Tco_1134089 [Tanacetum coccineum]
MVTMVSNNAQTTKSSSQALVAQDGLGGYDWSNDFEVEPVNYALIAMLSSSTSNLQTMRVVKEKMNETQIEKWERSSKNLLRYSNSQIEYT